MSSVSNSIVGSSGLDVQSVVDQLIYVERAPERLMQQRQATLDAQATAMRNIQSKLETLQDSVYSLKDITGALNARKVTSSDSGAVAASADSSAMEGTHTVTVQKLATTSSYYTRSITDSEYVLPNGSSLTLQVGDGSRTQVTLDGKNLRRAAEYLNSLNLGVRATTISDASGTRLALVSTVIGMPGAITLTSDSTDLAWQTSSPAQNAELLIDGVPVQSATNSISGVIAGVTLNITAASSTPVSLTVAPDADKVKQALSDFVDSYNDVINAVNAQFKVSSATNSAGVLASDSTLRGLQASLLSTMSYGVRGNTGAETLRSIGLEMQNDGTLKINENTFGAALGKNYDAVQNFFQSTSPQGFAKRLDALLVNLNDAVDGSIALDLKGMQTTRDGISGQINDFEVRIQMRQQQLLDEYSRIDVMLRKLPSLQSQISAQLGSLNSQ